MSQNKQRVTTQQLVDYFWEQSKEITTTEKVNIDFYEDTTVDVSVLLRNEQEGVNTMIQIRRTFDPVQDFIDAFDITEVTQPLRITLEDLFKLYREGEAELEVVDNWPA
ncbi:MAG TPA: hypothetical protein VKB19_06060 [Pedobacter sp.]|nr:hypothetical protein [Pedobacter sp.]